MKTCSKCKVTKEESEFFKDKRTKSGLYSGCKDCHRLNLGVVDRRQMRMSPTPQNVATVYLLNIGARLAGGKCYTNIKCLLSKDDLEKFLTNNWDIFLEQYKIWKENNFKRKFIPTLDRIDPKKHYKLNNIRLLPLDENAGLANRGKKSN